MNSFSINQQQKLQWLIRDCGQQAVQMSSVPFQVFEKGVHDYVTTIDRALDERLSSGIAALFPGDGIVTEENAHSWQNFHTGFPRLWFIDPIDGTDDLIHHKPHYAVMVGLLQGGNLLAGWVYAPALDRLYYGGPQWGLFQQIGNCPQEVLIPIEPPPPSQGFCPILIGNKDRRQFGEAITYLIPEAQFSSIGSFGLKVIEVITGRAGLYIYLNGRVKLWDTSGPLALAKAAGLICCDLAGNPLQFTSNAIDPDTLVHKQSIVIGWPAYVEALRTRLQRAVVLSQCGLRDPLGS